MTKLPVRGADILLPRNDLSYEKWAVVAVDQFTSQPEYWREVTERVGGAPSTLKLVLPEAYLSDSEARTGDLQRAMRAYMADGTLRTAVRDGYVLVERETSAGKRLGLMVCVDLEAYDFAVGARSAIRATEATVIERVPPRVKIRRGACLELTHVLMLLDDAQARVIEPLYACRDALAPLYDFELMQRGGRLRGWRVEGEARARVDAALRAVYEGCEGLFMAVGDGNHSLAAARQYWLELKPTLSAAQAQDHPARYALVELENLHSPAIQFEPIHRLLTGVEPRELIEAYEAQLRAQGIDVRSGGELELCARGAARHYGFDHHPLRELQIFLDGYLLAHPDARIDYIHGDDALRELADRPDAVGFMPCAFGKAELFPFIRRYGVLPRKTFSMGHANEKRYYLEARAIEN